MKKLLQLFVLLQIAVFSFGQKQNIEVDKYGEYLNRLDKLPYSKLLTEMPENQPKIRKWQKRVEFEKLKTIDPSTGEVPAGQLEKAREFVDKAIANAKSAKVTAGIPNVKWKELGPTNVGGRTRGIMYDPLDSTRKKVWSGAVSGGLWYNANIRDVNSEWKKIDDFWSNLAVTCLAYDPSNPKIFYAGTGEIAGGVIGETGNVWKSEDAGVTWKKLDNKPSNSSYSYRIVVNNIGEVFIATGAGIQKSTDGGITWKTALPVGATDIEMASDGIMYVATSGSKIYRSTNTYGTDWSEITPPNNGVGNRTELGLALSTKGNDQVIYAYSNTQWMKKSTDAGKTWSDIAIPKDEGGIHFVGNQGWYDLVITVHPTNPDLVYANGTGMARTIDGGKSWDYFGYWYIHPDHHGVVFNDKNPTEALFSCDGGVYFATDGGKSMIERPTINARNKGYNATQFYSLAIRNVQNDETVIGGTQDNGTWKINNSVADAGLSLSGGDGGFCFIDQDEPDLMLGSYQNGNLFTYDRNGNNFRSIISTDEGSFINTADYNSNTNTYFANYNSTTKIRRVKVSTSASSKDFLELNTSLGAAPSAFKTTPNNSLFLGTYAGKVFKVTNVDGTLGNVQEIGSKRMPTGYINCIEMGVDENELLAIYSSSNVPSVWYTNDGGKNWVNKDSTTHGLPNIPVKWAVFNPNNRKQVMLATDMGVWSTDDITASNPAWEVSNTGLANVRCDMIKCRASDGFVAVATHGRGIYTSYAFAPPLIDKKLTANLQAVNKKSCAGGSISIPFTTTGSFPANEEYSVYLSDQSGNFFTEQLIGKGTKSPIVCTIPTSSVDVTDLLSGSSYRIKIIANRAGVSSPSSDYITINAPQSKILSTVNNICNGFSTTIQASEAKNSYTYQWKRGGVILPNANSAKLTVSQAGIYSLDIYEDGCLSTSNNYSLNVGSLDYPSISAPITITCEGLTIPLSSADKPDYTLQWMKDGQAIPNATKKDFVVSSSGQYSLVYRQGSCVTTSVGRTFDVGKNIPVTIFSAFKPEGTTYCKGTSQDLYFSGTITNDMKFQWQKDGKDIVNALSTRLAVTQEGNYSLRMTMGKCVATSNPYNFTFTDSLKTTISTDNNLTNMCKGGRITLISSYQPYYYSASYTWRKNGTIIGNTPIYQFDVTESGDYSVSVEQGNCKATSPTLKIQVDTTNNLSVKLRSAWATELCANEPYSYIEATNSNSYPSDIKYTWNKDGVPITNANNWYYLASQSGVYTLTAQKDGCKGTSNTFVIKVGNTLSPPKLARQNSLSYIPIEKEMNFCEGQSVKILSRFDNSFQYINLFGSFQWQKDGKNITNANEATYDIKEPGIYRLAIKSGSCSAISDPITVGYTLVPNAITPNTDQAICENSSLVLKASATDKDLVYQWNKDNINITGSTSNSLTATQAGAYQFVVNRGLCSSVSDVVNVEVNSIPNAKATADQDASTLCYGQIITLSANTETGLTYQWMKDSVKIAQATGNILKVTEDGKYSVITNNGNCSNVSQALNINFIKVPTAITPTTAEQSLCDKSTLTLTAIDNNDPDVKYQWKRNNDIITTATTNGLKVTQEGLYQYVATKKGCTANSSTVNVKVIPLPKADVNYTGDPALLCLGENFTMNTTKEDGVVYQWKKDTVKIDKATDLSLQVSQTGKYSLTATRSGCPLTSSTVNVVFNDKPIASLTGGGSVYLTESSTLKVDLTSIAPWQIKLSDGKEYTATQTPYSISIIPKDTNAYTLTSVSNRCGTGTSQGNAKFKILTPLANEPILLDEIVLLATVPNPFKESCIIKFGLPKPSSVKLTLFDSKGNQKMILADEYKSAGWHSQTLTAKSLNEGVYILRMESNGQSKTQKLVLATE